MLIFIFLLCLTSSDAMLFPKVCLDGVTTFPVTCCPDFQGSPCGAAMNRGNCLGIQRSRAAPDPNVRLDDRDQFPSFFFNYMCQCKGNFTGYNCGECQFNHYGTYCENTYNIYRREVRELSQVELESYKAKLAYCKTKIDPEYVILRSGDRFRSASFQFIQASYYDVWCFSHYYGTKPFINNGTENYIINYAHGSTGFLTWHKLFSLLLERQMQRCLKDPEFPLIYYDWQRDQNCTICTDQYLGESTSQGYLSPYSVFSTWRSVCGNFDFDGTYCMMSDCVCERATITRNPGYTPGFSKPDYRDVNYCLSLSNFDTEPYTSASVRSARNCIEGWRDRFENRATSMHNLWHVYCGGTMAQVPISCNDPMFMLHHTFTDKIFERYITKWNLGPANYPPNTIYGHRPYDCISPFYNCWQHRQMLTSVKYFGVTYSNYNSF